MTQEEKKISQMMSLLRCSREEAIQVIEDDKRIDRGPTVYKFTQREKKAKPEKAQICSAMIEGLQSLGIADLDVTNEEREFLFTLNGVKYKVTLACPRK